MCFLLPVAKTVIAHLMIADWCLLNYLKIMFTIPFLFSHRSGVDNIKCYKFNSVTLIQAWEKVPPSLSTCWISIKAKNVQYCVFQENADHYSASVKNTWGALCSWWRLFRNFECLSSLDVLSLAYVTSKVSEWHGSLAKKQSRDREKIPISVFELQHCMTSHD